TWARGSWGTNSFRLLAPKSFSPLEVRYRGGHPNVCTPESPNWLARCDAALACVAVACWRGSGRRGCAGRHGRVRAEPPARNDQSTPARRQYQKGVSISQPRQLPTPGTNEGAATMK